MDITLPFTWFLFYISSLFLVFLANWMCFAPCELQGQPYRSGPFWAAGNVNGMPMMAVSGCLMWSTQKWKYLVTGVVLASPWCCLIPAMIPRWRGSSKLLSRHVNVERFPHRHSHLHPFKLGNMAVCSAHKTVQAGCLHVHLVLSHGIPRFLIPGRYLKMHHTNQYSLDSGICPSRV